MAIYTRSAFVGGWGEGEGEEEEEGEGEGEEEEERGREDEVGREKGKRKSAGASILWAHLGLVTCCSLR